MRWIAGVSLKVLVGVLAVTAAVPLEAITPDDATLRLFPRETQALGFIDVAGIRASTLFKEYMAEHPPYPKLLTDFANETGFAVDQDVDTVTIGRLGPRDVLAVVKARYNKQRVEYFLAAKQVSSETLMGRVIYYPDGKAAISFVDDLILVGSRQGVRAGVERMASVPPSDLRQNPTLMDAMRKVEDGNQVWGLGEFYEDMLPRGMNGPPELAELMRTLKGAVYQMRFDTDMHVKAMANFENAESAQAVGDLLRGMIALGRLQASQKTDLFQLFEGMSVDNAGSTLTMGAVVAGDFLKNLSPTLERVE